MLSAEEFLNRHPPTIAPPVPPDAVEPVGSTPTADGGVADRCAGADGHHEDGGGDAASVRRDQGMHVASFGAAPRDDDAREGGAASDSRRFGRSRRPGHAAHAKRRGRDGGFGRGIRRRDNGRGPAFTRSVDDARAGRDDAASTRDASGDGASRDDVDEVLERCRQAALTLLDAAPRASGALRDRLLAKGHEQAVVDDVIARLTRVDLLDDERYARTLIGYCADRMYGERGVMREMRRKGVGRELAERLVREAAQEGVFVDAAWELGRSIAQKTEGLDPQVRRRRFWSAAGRRGHDVATVHEVQHGIFDAH
ncbi:regulatory protein RecX [Bifidobacterium mongoliense]|uniref:Regulatory protein RecX n=1 Tax=Bifidobacterium mongoliense DSM 21395 TaxID=1437603 RepID=A0A087C167_9BIFI|nr:regulatory protein RecX [Bifidobacterium mongoliense]KFI77017.1 RecX-like protein [Bifidobacterium mongoliense DSM 21395]